VAGLTVLRAFVLAGRPDGDVDSLGSFESWSDLVARAIVFAGGANVIGARVADNLTAADDKDKLHTILNGLERLQGTEAGLTTRTVIESLWPNSQRHEDKAPDAFDDLRAAIIEVCATPRGQAPTTAALGAQLRRFRGRPAGGRKLVASRDSDNNTKWRVVHS
jgi:hypothetical protein